MLEKLYEYRKVFEAELVKANEDFAKAEKAKNNAEAQVAVVDFMIEAEEKKLAQNADTEIVEIENEVAEQPTDESY